jgi:hypothetical protein
MNYASTNVFIETPLVLGALMSNFYFRGSKHRGKTVSSRAGLLEVFDVCLLKKSLNLMQGEEYEWMFKP